VAIYCVNPAVELEARAAEFGSLRLDYLENGKVQLQGGGGGAGGGGEAGEARAAATTWAHDNDEEGMRFSLARVRCLSVFLSFSLSLVRSLARCIHMSWHHVWRFWFMMW
jgi:hypothetical protein